MSVKGKPYYITTAIAYASGKPHIGNTYEIILADAIARFKRQQGYDVRFQTGTDEHGQKIENKAKEAGISPKEYVDRTAAEIKRIWDLMNTSYDRFIRTTDEDHEKQVQKIFKKLYDQGDIYKGAYEGMYCTPCESFWTNSQLVDGKCPDCGRPVQPAHEEAYFFKMSKYADRLIEHIENHPEFIQPVQRKNEMMNNFLKPGLQDLCVSRTSFKWGIPVDFDPGHVVYVWLDALENYVTGLGYDADGSHGELYKKYWPADLHLIGKDIIRFHTIYWPIFLMAMGEPLPKQIFGHPWLIQEDGKMSKSRGNVIYADDMAKIFGVDAVRYFVLHEMPFETDGVISWDLIVERFNSDLANTLGNLVKRTISMSNQYLSGKLMDTGVKEAVDDDLHATVLKTKALVEKDMEGLRVADALTHIFNLFKRCNKYIDETTPWILGKEEDKKDRLSMVLYNLADSIVTGAALLHPFLPETAEKILSQLSTAMPEMDDLDKTGNFASGTKVTEDPEALFQRVKAEDVAKTVEELYPAKKEESTGGGKDKPVVPDKNKGGKKKTEESRPDLKKAQNKETITYDDFVKNEFRVGEIVEADFVEKSEKLLKFKVRIGDEERQILSGIRKYYPEPEKLIGKKVMAITNLAPRKMAGYESQGMLLCAEDEEGKLSLMTTDEGIISGAEIS